MHITVRRQIGMLITAHSVRREATVCREHGEELVKHYLEKTLIDGWWGVLAFPLNIFVIAADFYALWRLRKLPAEERVIAHSFEWD